MVKKVLTVIGARPQFVKASVLSSVFAGSEYFEEFIVHTGQHYDPNMSDLFFEQLDIPRPYAVLSCGKGSDARFVGGVISSLSEIQTKIQPDMVLLYGDTSSTLAGAVAANSVSIPIAHVEAGLRSYKRHMAEERNRVVTDHLSKYLFCPSMKAVENLKYEGIESCTDRRVECVGDIMYDAIRLFGQYAKAPKDWDGAEAFVLFTLHRPINVDNIFNLRRIVNHINSLADVCKVVWPIHPRTKKNVNANGLSISPRVVVYEPLSYLEMLYLLKRCNVVITDSGGLQKEAYFSGKKCYVVRDETEWVELVDAGHSVLIGDGFSKQIKDSQILENSVLEGECPYKRFLYGEGDTGIRILSHLINYLSI